jgi:ribonucleoside-triphosphate reductase
MVRSRQNEGTILSVRKRDGVVAAFDASRIAEALRKALEASGEGGSSRAWEIAGSVIQRLHGDCPMVEEIQDAAEEALMDMGCRKTARLFIQYRARRADSREMGRALDGLTALVDGYLDESDWRVRENSNMSFSLQGLNTHISSAVTSSYWLNRVYPPQVAEAHRSGELHIHDLGSLSSYCVGWDLTELLLKGFGGVPGKVESKPAKHFRTALGQTANFFYTLQGEAAGAQAFSNFDTLLAPFIRYDGLTYSEVKQAMQEFVFNLNVPTRTGFQTPFTNVTFDIEPPAWLAAQPAVIGGEWTDTPYSEFREERRMFLRAFCEVILEGDAKGRPFTFPIPTFNITPDTPWEDGSLDPVWRMTAKYGTPYFSNFVSSDMKPEDARSMCCRLRLDNREILGHEPSGDGGVKRGGMFNSNPLTGSVGVVTVNLPRLAFQSADEAEFLARAESAFETARTALEVKRKAVEKLTEDGLFPYTGVYLEGVKRSRGRFWANHFSTIGFLGMNEAFLNLGGKDYFTEEGKDFGERVMDRLLHIVRRFSRETGSLYNLEASPAESAGYRMALLDRKALPGIIQSGSTNSPYYTNSVHPPVGITGDLFAVLDHQDGMQSRFTGGTVLHVYTGERAADPGSVMNLIRAVTSNYRLPYVSFTPTYSICPVHGYLDGEVPICPHEHSTEDVIRYGNGGKKVLTEVWSRVVGYYRPVSQWNPGKQTEFSERMPYAVHDPLVFAPVAV